MDRQFIPLEPNLKFVSELKEDLKVKYNELHEKAKETLEGFFSTTVQNLYLDLHKLLTESVESQITIEKLQQIIIQHGYNQDHNISPLNPSSEVLGSSPNCSLKSLIRTFSLDDKKERKKSNKNKKNEQCIEKENVNNYDIHSEDFLSDMEAECLINDKSPVQLVVPNPLKVHNSPVFNKRKRSRKRLSSAFNNSSHSVTSSNDSITNNVNNASTFEKNIIDIDIESDREIEKESNKNPLKPIDNISSSFTPTRQLNKDCKFLSISKSIYDKTDFSEKGKKLRQTTLTLKKATPVIDISKDNSETNCSINDTKVDFLWNRSFLNKGKTSIENQNVMKCNINKNDLKTNRDSTNYLFETNVKDQNASTKDDELIEKSPAYNEKSKLRNKLSLSKKSESQSKIKTQDMITDIEVLSDLKNLKTDDESKYNQEPVSNTIKSREPQRSLSDDTYFSLAELTSNKTNSNDFTDCDMTEFEDEGKQETPPAKKILLSSFDEIPGRKEKSPNFAYKEGPIRKKSEKAQLPGWDCRDCKGWYGDLPEAERKKKMNLCSKHRGKYKADVLTPDSFWNPVFDDTEDSADDY